MSNTKVKVRMDRSKLHSTVHGEREPNDPHQGVVFFQEGLPYDGQGFLMYDRIPANDTKLRALADRKIAAASKNQVKAASPAPSDDGDGDNSDQGQTDNPPPPPQSDEPVNLESWLRGEASYEWHRITKSIREQFHKNVQNKTDAVTFLVEEQNVIAPGDLGDSLKANYVPAKV